jgi:hypothetical protein
MAEKHPPQEFFRQLEERLLQSEVRQSAEAVGDWLADDFVEFGSSGRVFDKQQIMAELPQESPTHRTLRDCKMTVLAPTVVLITYRAVRYGPAGEPPTHSLRSSIWQLGESQWQIVFHQGTLTKET